jgi:hypothetical protein
MPRIALSLLLCLPLALADAAPRRSHLEKLRFVRAHPCPATGQRSTSCKGYIIDHINPICAGGPDRASNMQWQAIADAKAKDRLERRMCRRGRP